LAALDNEAVEALVCCGDVVGYGASPNECLALLRERGIPIIAGNHDHASLYMTDISYFNEIAKAAVVWTKDHLTLENQDYIKSFAMTHKLGPLFFVHASPKNPSEWNYILTMGDARVNFEYFEEQFCFVGHSHQPFIIEQNGSELRCPPTTQIEIKEDCRYLVNVGSVGQPRDRNPHACYAVVDLDKKYIQLNRIAYDLKEAQELIIQSGLPRELAERLAHGW
ncbi:MAG: metallophosphoesterase family protein, partial [bacterium]